MWQYNENETKWQNAKNDERNDGEDGEKKVSEEVHG